MDQGKEKPWHSTALVAFKREAKFILNSSVSYRIISNRLFTLLNRYQYKLEHKCFLYELLKLGDELLQKEKYMLAQAHGYRRYLFLTGVKNENISTTLSSLNEEQLAMILRALLGDCTCNYYIALQKDKFFQLESTLTQMLSLLQITVMCMQSGLCYENLYWLVHNAVTLTYSLARQLLSVNLPEKVIESLLWCCVSMESSVPLMTIKYLSLRTNIYTAVCASYFAIHQPQQAELFARRALDKIHQLAQIHHLHPCGSSIEVFSEATIKLGVMIFKRSVLESHKKTKSVLRPKVRPTVKDLLQSAWPRSPTEKLLDEMFIGQSAQFLAILESLSFYSRPFERKSPQPVSQLDSDTITDVYQELFTAGADLALRKNYDDSGSSLIALAIQGSDAIPFSSVVKFIHCCYQLDCLEVFSLLANVAIEKQITSIKILSLVDELRKHEIESKKVWDKCMLLLDILYSINDSECIDKDVILDSSLLVWSKISEVYSGVVNYNSTACKSLLEMSRSNLYIEVIRKMVSVFDCVKLYLNDPLLYGEVVFKYILMLESLADRSICQSGIYDLPSFMYYDRQKLLNCLQILERCLINISTARIELWECNSKDGSFSVFHTEMINTHWRLKVKLNTTIPPDCDFENESKPSSLLSKVKERKERLDAWNKIISEISSSDVVMPTENDLLEECGADNLQHALLLINLAEFTNRHYLLKEALSYLSSYNYSDSTAVVSSTVPPPPMVIKQSPTMLSFSPVPYTLSNKVSYYMLFGCVVDGNNKKVRLSDYHFNGLGIEVPANEECTLNVSGLKPNTKYIFAIAAYDCHGDLLGDSIGCSTKPILTAHCYSPFIVWGYLCQCAYKLKDFMLADHAANILWQQFVHPLASNSDILPVYRLKQEDLSKVSGSLLHLFISAVFVQVQCVLKGMEQDNLESFMTSAKLKKFQLVAKLQLALKLSGWVNSYLFSLQAVIMCYTLLVPLMQKNQIVMKILLECHSVLQELPDHILINRLTITSIHHMVATISYYIAKAILFFNQKSLLPALSEHSRLLLFRTFPSIVENATANSTLQNSSLGSMTSTGHVSMMSFTTQSSLIHDKNTGQQPKKKKKKTLVASDDIADEVKTPQYRALEACFISLLGLPTNEEIDFNGQEDPVFLHAIINTSPVQTVYKEVIKFKRRPQYLEYFVHLCDSALKHGKGELVLSWSADLFSWLAKRNEILLSVKSPQLHKSQLTPPAVKNQLAFSQDSSKQQKDYNKREATSRNSEKAYSEKTNETSLRPASVRKAEVPLTVVKRRITRDDLSSKAVTTLQNLLPRLWRMSRCRRRLRTACIEEQPWRAQMNIILASCVLKSIVDRFEQSKSTRLSTPVDWSRPDIAGEFFDNAFPPFCLASHESKFDRQQGILNTADLYQLLLCYQRAVVLAYRGSCWILVSNACRGLCNALTILRHLLKEDKNSIAELYGLSLRTLYIAVFHLLDMHKLSINESKLCSSSNFLKHIALLGIQICYVNHHWEKTIVLADQLTSIINVDDILSPIIRVSQMNLSERIEQYSVQRQAIAPAAHLDLQAYDLYEKVGHSLGLTNVSFKPPLDISHKKKSGDAQLFLSCKLVAQYFNVDNCSGSVMSVGDIEHITDQYSEAISTLLIEENLKLAVDGMHELGNLMHFAHKIKSASHWWKKGLKTLLKCEAPLLQWRSCSFGTTTTTYFLTSGLLASKLARYTYYKELDVQKEYVHLAADLFKKFLQAFYCHPVKDIDYAIGSVSIDNDMAAKLSHDYYCCNSSLLLSCLQFVSQKLVTCSFPLQAMPVLFLYEYAAYNLAHNIHHTVFAQSYKVLSLTQLSLLNKAVKLLQELMSGKSLPYVSSEHYQSNAVVFDECMPLNHPGNIKILSSITETNLSNSLREKYGVFCYVELMLVKCQLLIQIASICEEVPLATHQLRTLLSADMCCSEIKAILLEKSQYRLLRLLKEIDEKITGSDYMILKIRCYHLLAEISLAQHCYVTAAQLYLAALREMQVMHDKTGINLDIWLKTKVLLMNALSQVEWNFNHILCLETLFSEAVDECEACGDVEHHSQLLYISACKQYSIKSSLQTEVISLCQSCIDKLNSCPVLSQNGKLLKIHASLLLSEILSQTGPNSELVTVYNGLAESIKHQLREESADNESIQNLCKPQLPLLAHVYYQATHLHIKLADSSEAAKTAHLGIELCQKMMSLFGQNLMTELTVMLYKVHQKSERLINESVLIEALSHVLKFDYVQTLVLYCILAEMLSTHCSEQSISVSTQSVSKPAGQKRLEISSQEEKELAEKHKYLSWCAVKMASHCLQMIDKLKQLTSEVHNEEMASQIPSKLLSELPQFAVLNLCGSNSLLLSLLTTLNIPVIDDLLPPSQTNGLTWFTLLEYFKSTLNHSFVPDGLWQSHTHHLSSRFIPKVQALFSFLVAHCSNFKALFVLPSLPELFRLPPDNAILSVLTASENEMSVLWYSSSIAGSIRGYMAFNDKPVKSVMHRMSHNMGIDVFTFVTTHEQLQKLCCVWNKLANTCTAYLASQSTRPLSRSPSRMKQRSLEQMKQSTPPDLTKQIEYAVKLLLETLQVTQIVPHVEPHVVPSISRALKPGIPTTEKGEACYFFKNIFLSCNKSNQ